MKTVSARLRERPYDRRFSGHLFATDAADIPLEMAKRPDLFPGKVGRENVVFDEDGDIQDVKVFDGFADREWDFACDLSMGSK